MYLFLDVERRRVDNEVAPILPILSAPDEPWVEVGIAGVPHRVEHDIILLEHGLVLGGGNVFPLGLVVLEGFDGFTGGCLDGFPGHVYSSV